jgi:hypothetical protein
MKVPKRNPAPEAGWAPAPEAPNLTLDPAHATAALDALLATGLSRWDAMVALVAAGVKPAAFPDLRGVPRAALCPFPSLGDALYRFHTLAQKRPEAGNAALNAYLKGVTVADNLRLSNQRWVTALPSGLRVERILDLQGTGVTALPEGLESGGTLDLRGTPIVSLPAGLAAYRGLLLTGCRAWDGRIPEDLRTQGPRPNVATLTWTLHTDAHPDGLTLPAWRALHPHGERP